MNHYYVYIYQDPFNKEPFYVGKGKNNRAYEHLYEAQNKRENKTNIMKIEKIRQILNECAEPIIEFFKTGLSEKEALSLEKSLIKKYGRIGIDPGGILTNRLVEPRLPSQKGKKFPNRKSPSTKGKSGPKWSVIAKQQHKLRMKEVMSCEETREKCRKAKLGKPGHSQTNESKKKIGLKNSIACLTEEQRANKTNSKLGELNPNFGCKWYNDGNSCRSFKPEHAPGDWQLGRLPKRKRSAC